MRIGILVVILLAAVLTACSSTGFSTKEEIVAPKTIKAPAYVHPEVAPYLPEFVAMLQAKGFNVGKTDDPRALELRLEFNGNVFNMRVSASLWKDGIPVLTASATNSGWGTALARGSAVNSLADSAASVFQTELQDLSSHLQIVPDSVAAQGTAAGH